MSDDTFGGFVTALIVCAIAFGVHSCADCGPKRCDIYCRNACKRDHECKAVEYDGGRLRYTPTGYECRCANLQAVKP
jgi:hypothetical protein